MEFITASVLWMSGDCRILFLFFLLIRSHQSYFILICSYTKIGRIDLMPGASAILHVDKKVL